MFCAISNTTPEHPVVSTKSGHLFERSVIEKAIEATGARSLMLPCGCWLLLGAKP
jgi:pre-mRNA-processing factor 19